MPDVILWIISFVIAYLLGSISFGIIVSHIGHGPDLRTVGSKSTGASNVQRTMGWKYGLITESKWRDSNPRPFGPEFPGSLQMA